MNCRPFLAREKIQTSSINAKMAQIPLKTVKATLHRISQLLVYYDTYKYQFLSVSRMWMKTLRNWNLDSKEYI